MKTRELKQKSVISVKDGRCIGYISDLDIDPACGRVNAIFVPVSRERLFGGWEEICIPWGCIVKLGEDAILVEVPEGVDCRPCPDRERKRFCRWF